MFRLCMAKNLNKLSLQEYDLFFSKTDDCYVCKSNEFSDVIGIGDTEDEAIKTYYEILEEYLKDLKNNKSVKNKGGRPKKTNAKLLYNVPHEIKAFIEAEAVINDVNQGVIVERTVKFYQDAHKDKLSEYWDLKTN